MSRLIDADALHKRIKAKNTSNAMMRVMKAECLAEIDDAPTIVPERKTGKWIPCSDTPDTNRNVFIARGEQDNMTACIGHYDHDYKQWYEDRNWFARCLYDGLYWCEIPALPEPYMKGEHED